MGDGMLDRVSFVFTVRTIEKLTRRSELFWGYMQRHWEDDLHGGEALTVSGDEIPQGESAVVISVRLASTSKTRKHNGLTKVESSMLFGLLFGAESRGPGGDAREMSVFRQEGLGEDPVLRLGFLGGSPFHAPSSEVLI